MHEKVFEKRATLYRPMAPKKRRVLTKLLCLRMMQNTYAPTDDAFFGAFQESRISEAESSIAILEKRTIAFLDTCERNDMLTEKFNYSANLGSDTDDRSVLQEGDKVKLQNTQGEVELLSLWEQIISALEEGLDSDDTFAKKIFSGDKLERWYSYRDQLLSLLASCKAKLNSPGFLDPMLSARRVEAPQLHDLFDSEFDDNLNIDELLDVRNVVEGDYIGSQKKQPGPDPVTTPAPASSVEHWSEQDGSSCANQEGIQNIDTSMAVESAMKITHTKVHDISIANSDSEDSVSTMNSVHQGSEEEVIEHYRRSSRKR